MNEPEVYKENRCWYTFNGRKFDTPQHTCGLPATLYRIMKNVEGGRLYALKETKGITYLYASVFLCDKHKKAIESKGYTATIVQRPK